MTDDKFTEADYQRIRQEIEKRRLEFYRPYKKQQMFHKAAGEYRETLLRAGNQLGKELINGTPVLTPSGWVAIEKLRVGDCVIGGDGNPCYVTGVYPQGVKPVVEMIFDDGASVKAGYEHLWKCRQGKRRYTYPHEWDVRTTAQIIAAGGASGDNQRVAEIPVCSSYMTKGDVKVDPYIFGLMAGDGCYSGTSTMPSLSSGDKEIIDYVSKFYPLKKSATRKYDYFVAGGMVTDLKFLGVWGTKSYDKKIPKDYLWNSAPNRLALLRGLMDSDGFADKSGRAIYYSTSPKLIEDVVFLARSLGGKAKVANKQTYFYQKGVRVAGKPSWAVSLSMPVCPFKLKRKSDRWKKLSARGLERRLVSALPAGEGECTCISVDSHDHTYVTKDFIVTHNTMCAAANTAIHATGKYPSWWQGVRLKKAPVIWCAGVTGEVVRDSIQKLLIGDSANPGTGFIPKDDIVETTASRGVADLIDTIYVKHVSGGKTRIRLKYYEQGREKFQADTVDVVWLDEEPPLDIYVEALTRTNATKGFLYMTFTPLKGMSEVVRKFLHEKSPDRCDINMTIEDALHIAPEERQRIIDSYPAHERSARIMGHPVLGSGRVFPVAEEDIACDPFDMASVPFFWLEIAGIDFGWDHPTAAVKVLYNPQDDIVYVTNTYKRREATPIIHAAALRPWGKNIPWAWPHDGNIHDKNSGEQLSVTYREQGLNMLAEHATFENGSNSVEAGVTDMLMRMETGRFKVFRHLSDWFEEFRLYHRKEGKLVKEYDDLLACLHPDSQIITNTGVRKIINMVGTEGRVLTIDGKWVDYKNCRMTRAHAEVVEVTFGDGHRLICTPDHKLLCHDGEWVPAIDSVGMICHNAISHRRYGKWNILNMAEVYIHSMIRCAQTAIMSVAGGGTYIASYMKRILGRYQKDFMCTTSTATERITFFSTSLQLMGGSIYLRIIRGTQEIQCGLASLKKNGLHLLLGKNFFENRDCATSTLCGSSGILHVNAAGWGFPNRMWEKIDFVQIDANPNCAGMQGWTTLKNNALNVAQNLWQTSMQKVYAVRDHAVEKCGSKAKRAPNTLTILSVRRLEEKSNVYCMEVPATNAFALVNGAVVHNCTRYALMQLRSAARVRKSAGMINGYPIEEDNARGMHQANYNPLSRDICRNIKR